MLIMSNFNWYNSFNQFSSCCWRVVLRYIFESFTTYNFTNLSRFTSSNGEYRKGRRPRTSRRPQCSISLAAASGLRTTQLFAPSPLINDDVPHRRFGLKTISLLATNSTRQGLYVKCDNKAPYKSSQKLIFSLTKFRWDIFQGKGGVIRWLRTLWLMVLGEYFVRVKKKKIVELMITRFQWVFCIS